MSSHIENLDKLIEQSNLFNLLFNNINVEDTSNVYHENKNSDEYGAIENVGNTSEERESSDDMLILEYSDNTSQEHESSDDNQGFKQDAAATATDLMEITNDFKGFDEYLLDNENVEMLTEDEYIFKYFIEDLSKTPTLSSTLNETALGYEEVNEAVPKPEDDIIVVEDDVKEIELKESRIKNKVLQFSLVKSPITIPLLLGSIRHLFPIYGKPLRYLLFDNIIGTVVGADDRDLVTIQFSTPSRKSVIILLIECGICSQIMNRSELRNHLKIHKEPETKRYICLYCKNTYKGYNYLVGHVRRHLGIRPYRCVNCKSHFSTKQELGRHIKTKYQIREQYMCETCGKTYSQNTLLKRHQKSVHEKDPLFQCPDCPKGYYVKCSLNDHILTVHKGERRMLSCGFCDMKFRNAHLLTKHRKENHLNQTIFLCHVCYFGSVDINYFNAHRRSIQCLNNTRLRQENNELLDESKHVEESQVECIIDGNGHSILDQNNELSLHVINDNTEVEVI